MDLSRCIFRGITLAALLSTGSCLAPVSMARGRDKSTQPVRIFKFGKSNRLLIRFQGDPAKELYEQFLHNYKNHVTGVVDGTDTACLKSQDSDKKAKTEYICAFILNPDGHITNVFNPNPTNNEDTLAQLVLAPNGQLDRDIDADTFRQEDMFEIGGDNKTVRKYSDKKFKGFAYSLTGEDVELVYHFLESGKARKLGSPHEGFADVAKAVHVERAGFECTASINSNVRSKYKVGKRKPADADGGKSEEKPEKKKKSKDEKSKKKKSSKKASKKDDKSSKTASSAHGVKAPSKDLSFECRFGFDRQGVARAFISSGTPKEIAKVERTPTRSPDTGKAPGKTTDHGDDLTPLDLSREPASNDADDSADSQESPDEADSAGVPGASSDDDSDDETVESSEEKPATPPGGIKARQHKRKK